MQKPQAGPGVLRLAVVVGDSEIGLNEAVRLLAGKALHGAGEELLAKIPSITETLLVSLGDGGSDMRRGVAVLKARIPQLREARPALGVWRRGLKDLPPGQEPLQVLFVWLTPGRVGTLDIPNWARQGLSDDKGVYRLKNAVSAKEAMAALGMA